MIHNCPGIFNRGFSVMPKNHLPIAIDAMGGDYAPDAIVEGAIEAGEPCILVGLEKELSRLLESAGNPSFVQVVHAETAIGMDENPLQAIRAKKDSSLSVAIRLVKDGKADGVLSAGNSGALTMGATMTLGRLPEVQRPAAAIPIPNPVGQSLLLDAGAAAECNAEDLVNYAVMGSTYARLMWGIANPRIGLLSIGEEESKGSRQARDAHRLLKGSGLNFIGNVQGSDLGKATADVIVTDGFTGNVALKAAEGFALLIMGIVKDELAQAKGLQKLAAWSLRPIFRRVKKRLDWQEYGGGALLGVSGNVVIAHGKSNKKAIGNAIRLAAQLARTDLLHELNESLTGFHKAREAAKLTAQATDKQMSATGQ
jgi:glycerol-3-phosphate acyltransferase PlsX